jgi:hypothetical protein
MMPTDEQREADNGCGCGARAGQPCRTRYGSPLKGWHLARALLAALTPGKKQEAGK